MKKLRAHLTYTAFLFAGALIIVGCSTLFERVPGSGQGTNNPAVVQLSENVAHLIKDTGNTFGPLGGAIAGAAILTLHGVQLVINKRNTQKAIEAHLAEAHPVEETKPTS